MKLLGDNILQEFTLVVLGEVGFILLMDTVNCILLAADAGPLDKDAIAGIGHYR